MTAKATNLEIKALMALYNSEYMDTNNPIGCPVWNLEEGDVEMEKGQLAGVLSSCVKKDFIKLETDSTCLTIKGFEIIKNLIS